LLLLPQVVVLQAVCFKEIIGLSFQHSSVRRYVRPEKMLVEEKEVPLFKAMNWCVGVTIYTAFVVVTWCPMVD
jgi:hypothetical protein